MSTPGAHPSPSNELALLREIYDRQDSTLNERISHEIALVNEKTLHLFDRLTHEIELINEKISARDTALSRQSEQNQIHFNALNHENERVLKATEVTVSRDTWDEFLKGDSLWKAGADRALQNVPSRTEFQAYKDATQTALLLKEGQTKGLGMASSTFVTLLVAAGILFAIIVNFRTIFG